MVGVTIDGTNQPASPPQFGPDQPVEYPTPPPYYLAYPQPLPGSPQQRKRRRFLVTITTVWVLVLLVSGVWYSFHGAHTVREQTTIAQAAPVVDAATGWVVHAAGPGPVVEVGGYVSSGNCDITPVRAGEQWQRGIRLATPVGSEPALLKQISAGLPSGYHARVHSAGAASTLFADAGDYVGVLGSIEGPGLVRVVVNTGCRAVGHRPTADPTSPPTGPAGDAVESVLSGFGVTAAGWQRHEVSCGAAGSGSVVTVSAVASGVPGQALDKGPTPNGTVVVSGGKLLAVRDGAVATLARADLTTFTVSATTGTCA